ncbi:hypothetical protein AB0O27_30305 [Streptomyces hydrogenans]
MPVLREDLAGVGGEDAGGVEAGEVGLGVVQGELVLPGGGGQAGLEVDRPVDDAEPAEAAAAGAGDGEGVVVLGGAQEVEAAQVALLVRGAVAVEPLDAELGGVEVARAQQDRVRLGPDVAVVAEERVLQPDADRDGHDRLVGEDARDLIEGGRGADRLHGGGDLVELGVRQLAADVGDEGDVAGAHQPHQPAGNGGGVGDERAAGGCDDGVGAVGVLHDADLEVGLPGGHGGVAQLDGAAEGVRDDALRRGVEAVRGEHRAGVDGTAGRRPPAAVQHRGGRGRRAHGGEGAERGEGGDGGELGAGGDEGHGGCLSG